MFATPRAFLILLSVSGIISLNLFGMNIALDKECDIAVEQEMFRDRCNSVIEQYGQKALVYAVMMPRDGDIPFIQALLDRGLPCNQRSSTGISPLHYAVRNNHEKIICLLLNYGADINIQDYFGNTPLHVAALEKHPAIVLLLLRCRADLAIKNARKQTPHDLIILWDSSFLQSIEEKLADSVDIQKFLDPFADYMEKCVGDSGMPRSLSQSIDLFDVLDQLGSLSDGTTQQATQNRDNRALQGYLPEAS